jgi:hypothetical protein
MNMGGPAGDGQRPGVFTVDTDRALEAIRVTWGNAYAVCFDDAIEMGGPRWQAWRIGGHGTRLEPFRIRRLVKWPFEHNSTSPDVYDIWRTYRNLPVLHIGTPIRIIRILRDFRTDDPGDDRLRRRAIRPKMKHGLGYRLPSSMARRSCSTRPGRSMQRSGAGNLMAWP